MTPDKFLNTDGVSKFWETVKVSYQKSSEAIFFINYVAELTKGKSYIFTTNDYVGTPVVGRMYVMFGGDGSRWAGGLGRVTEFDSASGNVTVENSYWDYLTVDAYTKQEIDDKIMTIGSSVGGVPLGAIMIWSGSEDDIPTGWALCDGQDGRFDLRHKFVLGAGPNHPVGETGGSEEVELTIGQLANHRHIEYAPRKTSRGVFPMGYIQDIDQETTSPRRVTFSEDSIIEYGTISSMTISTESVGNSQPHPNMPPYYALCYIVKIAPDETDGITMEQVNEAIDSAIKPINDKKADAIFETVGPASSVEFNMASEGSLLHPVSEIKLVQEGEGTPSLENIRNITGWSSIALTHNETATTQPLPETVYGGSYDWAKGELTVTHKYYKFTGNEYHHIYSIYFYIDITEEPPPDFVSGICSHYKYTTYGSPGCIGISLDGKSAIYTPGDFYTLDETGIEEWLGYLKSQVDAGTPVQIVWRLADPHIIQLTPHDFLALSGINTLSSDCGDTTVTFSTDLEKYIERNSTAIMSQVNEAIDIAINGAIEGAY